MCSEMAGMAVLFLAMFAGGLELAAGAAGASARAVGVGCVIFAVSLGLVSERSASHGR